MLISLELSHETIFLCCFIRTTPCQDFTERLALHTLREQRPMLRRWTQPMCHPQASESSILFRPDGKV